MAALTFESTVFGPIHSRRLGTSLGINLLPPKHKVCSFNCVYCECGWNPIGEESGRFPTVEEFYNELEAKLVEMKSTGITPDVITFSGNGEPTLHPMFAEIMDKTIELRDKYFKDAKICVLSNATRCGEEKVFNALLKADKRILKVDSAIEETIFAIDQPVGHYSLSKVVENLKRYHGNFTLQTLFLKGEHNGKHFDNTTPEELEAWYALVREVKPKEVMLYTLDRATPEENLTKVSVERLNEIAAPLKEMGIAINIAG